MKIFQLICAWCPFFNSNGFAASEEASIIGQMDLRPSMHSKYGYWATENEFELGYRFNTRLSLSYAQFIETNMYLPRPVDNREGLGFSPTFGFVRTRLDKLLEDSSKTLSLSYENRIYLPTLAADREAGQLSIIRNYIKFSKILSESFTLTLIELPIFYLYTKPGYEEVGGDAYANPTIENRIYLVAEWSLTRDWVLTLPLLFHITRYSDFRSDAVLDKQVGYTLWIYPEILYSLSSNTSIGAAYYSKNLVKNDLSGWDPKGWEDSVFQFVFATKI